MACSLLIATGFALAGTVAGAIDLAGRATVIDGDTIDVRGQRIRLFGIDAPELEQTCEAGGETYRCGEQAALALGDHIGQQTVACERRDIDRDGYIFAVCHLDAEDLSAWLVAQGWALAYRHYSTDYVGEEAAARIAKRGIWRGRFKAPWEWRRNRQTPFG